MAAKDEKAETTAKPAGANAYGNGPLRYYFSSMHHHEDVEDYFAPHHAIPPIGNPEEKGQQDSPYCVIERYKQGVEFRGKFIGCQDVAAATGEEMCRTTLARLRTAARINKQHKTRVIIRLTDKELNIIDQDKEKTMYSIKLNKVSYILPDPCDQHAFGFICGEKTGPWAFYGLKTVSPAIAVIVAVKEIFEALAAILKGNVGHSWMHNQSQVVVDRYKYGIEFRGKLVGSQEVPSATGDDMAYDTLNKLRAEVKVSKKHKTRVVIHITDKELFIIDQERGNTLHALKLDKVTHIISDPNDEHAFGFITGDKSGPWTFYGLKTVLPSLAPISVITELLTATRSLAREAYLIKQDNEKAGIDGKSVMPDRLKKVMDHFKNGVEFRGKLIGVENVAAPTGDEIALTTLAKLRASVLISKVHKPRVVIFMSEKEIQIKSQDDGTVVHKMRISKISYVASDPNDERAFGFICGEHEGPWFFFGLKTVLPSIAAIAALRDLSEASAFLEKHKVQEGDVANKK